MASSVPSRCMRREDDVMMSIADMHIRHEDLDLEAARFGVDPDYVVVMSRHSSPSGSLHSANHSYALSYTP